MTQKKRGQTLLVTALAPSATATQGNSALDRAVAPS